MSKKIFIVDDDKDMVESTKILLEANGYEVKYALNIEKGHQLIESEKPDLIILDVMFPDNQSAGFEFCQKLRSNEKTKKIPLIMYTAINKKFPFHYKPDEEYLPADELINKPIKPSDLLERINKLLK